MLSAILLAIFLVECEAAGVGKAWEVSPVNTDRPSSISSWPRMESSPFEVRSISGVGRLAPSENHRETFEREKKREETTENPEDRLKEASSETSTISTRDNRELEDFENGNIFVPEVIFRDLTADSDFRKSKEIEDVEAVHSVWKKFRRHGRAGRNHGRCSEVEEVGDEIDGKPNDESMRQITKEESSGNFEDKARRRRETETEMEKIGSAKNVREARLNSPESWSKQPISIEFRHRTKLEAIGDEEQEQLARSEASHGIHAPNADFVTTNRRMFSENRESRDLPISAGRSFDEMPLYRNTLRDRDGEPSYSRGLFYPDRYRTERDYFVRGINDQPQPPIYPQDRYREVDFDLYGRSRPMPKPKRIIYYATLPEVIRKPVDTRSYPRQYDPITRSTIATGIEADGFYKRRTTDPGRYRYYSYPYGNYDNYDIYGKRTIWNDRPYASPYPERIEDVRRREQDMDHANMKEAARNEDAMLDLSNDGKMPEMKARGKPNDQDKLPWPVQIGTEVSVKENERISGRKIFAQREDFNRFRKNARMDRESPPETGEIIN